MKCPVVRLATTRVQRVLLPLALSACQVAPGGTGSAPPPARADAGRTIVAPRDAALAPRDAGFRLETDRERMRRTGIFYGAEQPAVVPANPPGACVAAQIYPLGVSVAGLLDPAQWRTALRAHLPVLAGCLTGPIGRAARLRVRVIVQQDGAVTRASASDVTGVSRTVATCIEHRIELIRLPTQLTTSTVTQPFDLEAGSPPGCDAGVGTTEAR